MLGGNLRKEIKNNEDVKRIRSFDLTKKYDCKNIKINDLTLLL
jgi:hypothetical protein